VRNGTHDVDGMLLVLTNLAQRDGLGVEREGARFALTSGEPRLRFAPSTGRVEVEVYTAPFLVGVPAILRAFAPQLVGLVSVTVQE
jgi:hypothetical protein